MHDVCGWATNMRPAAGAWHALAVQRSWQFCAISCLSQVQAPQWSTASADRSKCRVLPSLVLSCPLSSGRLVSDMCDFWHPAV